MKISTFLSLLLLFCFSVFSQTIAPYKSLDIGRTPPKVQPIDAKLPKLLTPTVPDFEFRDIKIGARKDKDGNLEPPQALDVFKSFLEDDPESDFVQETTTYDNAARYNNLGITNNPSVDMEKVYSIAHPNEPDYFPFPFICLLLGIIYIVYSIVPKKKNWTEV